MHSHAATPRRIVRTPRPAGYRGPVEFRQLRTDPDLEALRADARFEGLIARFERKQPEKSGFLGLF
jgi:hypothetical protein